jgi:hypothetical protein
VSALDAAEALLEYWPADKKHGVKFELALWPTSKQLITVALHRSGAGGSRTCGQGCRYYDPSAAWKATVVKLIAMSVSYTAVGCFRNGVTPSLPSKQPEPATEGGLLSTPLEGRRCGHPPLRHLADQINLQIVELRFEGSTS